jgi:hemoglobin-like flavoprotein
VNRWDDDTRTAWMEVYTLVATTMINAENGLESVPDK